MRCGGCGYFLDAHVTRGKDVRCPVCACGETVDAHRAVVVPPSPLLAFAEAGKVTYRCPGKDTQLRHGAFREAPPPETLTYLEILARDAARWRAEAEEAARPYEPPPLPLVPARPPRNVFEFAAHGGGQAAGLGRKAVAAGWRVGPFYWKAADGAEGCAVQLAKGPLRAVATWKRKAGHAKPMTGWSADVAYAWRVDVERFPTKLTHTDLERLIR